MFSGIGSDKFSQQIIDNKFVINGIQYVLVVEGNNKYIRYARLDDNRMIPMIVSYDESGNGICEYRGQVDGEIKIQFGFNDSNPNKVDVIQHYRTNVINRVESETCSFDGKNKNIELDSNRTFEWYVANEILSIVDGDP